MDPVDLERERQRRPPRWRNLPRLLRWLAGVVVILTPLAVCRLGGAAGLSLAGLVLDVVGAMILTWGLIRGAADEIRNLDFLYVPGDSRVRWWRNLPLAFALRLGTPLANFPGDASERLEDNFWGLIILTLGFVCQAAGQVVAIAVR
jgi:hypothetical protein